MNLGTDKRKVIETVPIWPWRSIRSLFATMRFPRRHLKTQVRRTLLKIYRGCPL